MKRKSIVVLAVAVFASSSISLAYAETDPFPGVALGGEVGPHQILNSQGNPADGSAPIECPAGSGRGIVSNATTHETYQVCTKTWRPTADVAADQAFRDAQQAAQAAAEAESKAWNEAHPGQQKCVQWGPIVHANGVSTASGGVCANPVPVSAPSSPLSAGASSSPSSSGSSSSAPADTATVVSTPRTAAPSAASAPSAATVAPDPYPNVAIGAEIPGTRITSAPGLTQTQWEATSAYQSFSCPNGTGRGMGVDMNFTTSPSDDTWFAYCVKQSIETSSTPPSETSTATKASPSPASSDIATIVNTASPNTTERGETATLTLTKNESITVTSISTTVTTPSSPKGVTEQGKDEGIRSSAKKSRWVLAI